MNKQISGKTWLIGLLFLMGLGLLLVLTFGTRQVSLFTSSTYLTVYFPSARGIQEGNAVRLMGVKKGNVKSSDLVAPDQVPSDRKEYRVKVILKLDGRPEDLKSTLSGHYRFLVRSSSVLGGTEISVERTAESHPDSQPIRFDGPNYGSAEPQGIQAISEWFSENKSSLSKTVDSIQSASDSIQKISTRIEKGEGTVGKLINDDDLYKQFKSIADNTQKITSSIEQGDGVLGRLVNSEEMGKNLESTLSDLREATNTFREMAEKMNSGEGTISRLINDKDMAKNLESTLDEISAASKNIRKISDRIQSGKGTVGKLVQDEGMGKNLETILSNLKEASKSIRNTTRRIDEGEGSLGKLVNDETLYNEAQKTVKSLSDVTGSVSRIRTFVGLDTRYFADTEHSIHQAYLRVHADENKFLQVGASLFDLDHPDTTLQFKDGVEDQQDQLFNTISAQLGRKFYDGNFTLRGGLIEGKVGAGADYDLYVPFLNRDLTLSVEGRGAYSDVEDNQLDENLDSDILLRSSVSTSFLNYGRLQAGVSRIGEDEEVFVGLGFEYEDEDIRNFFSLLGLAN